MPTSKYFDRCPAFPSNLNVAKLPYISLKKLYTRDDNEITKLFQALRHEGFFQLDLRDSEPGRALLNDAEIMFDLADETLNYSHSALEIFKVDPKKGKFEGWKPAGITKVGEGKYDAVEVYSMAQDELIGNLTPAIHPMPIENHWKACKEFCHDSRTVAGIMLNALDSRLGLPQGTLASLSDPNHQSNTLVRWLLTRPKDSVASSQELNTSFGQHTDAGLITILFNVAGGLQTLPAGKEDIEQNWQYVRPEEGHAIINLGDTLVEWTGGVLRSSLHRVVTAPGPQGAVERISVVYLSKAKRGASMRRLRGDGSVIPEPREGEEETCTVDEHFKRLMVQVLNGTFKPRTTGGAPVPAL